MRKKHEYTVLASEERDLDDDIPDPKQAARVSRAKVLSCAALVCLFVLGLVIWVGVGFGGLHRKTSSTGSGTPTPPSTRCGKQRLRREWRSLQTHEKREYIEAVKCISTKPSAISENATAYDDFPYIHSVVGEAKEIDHLGMPNFLPFHRYLLHIYEQVLETKCGYSGGLTYWDWTLDWTDLPSAPVWDDELGFGGDGDPDGEVVYQNGRCVTSGPFAKLRPLYCQTQYKPHCLSRGFRRGIHSGRLLPGDGASPLKIDEILAKNSFDEFFHGLEMGPHNFVPFSIQGDLLGLSAPSDPLFYLHHTQLDRLWWTWQQRGSGRTFAYGVNGSLDDLVDMHGLNPNRRIRELMSTDSELMCYRYL